MSYPYWKNQSQLPTHADVVIVGGGYIGMATAYWLLTYKPHLKVVVIDSQELGQGASGRNAGFLTKGSLSFYQHLSLDWGLNAAEDIFSFAQESIDLVSSHLKLLDARSCSSYSNYTQIKDFSFKGFKQIKPILKHTLDCFEATGEMSINPMLLLMSLEEKIKELKAQVFRGIDCFQLEGKLLHTSHGNIQGEEIVIALNGYTESLISGVVQPKRAQMLCVELAEEASIPGLMYEPDNRVYFKSIGEKRIVIGGKRLIDAKTEETALIGINPKIQLGLENYVEEYLGKIQTVLSRWSGIMGFSSDELPIITKRSDCYLITGFSGHGMGFGFNASRNLSEMILHHKTSFFDSLRTHCRVKNP